MPYTDTTVNNLIINVLTKAQYESLTPSDSELYLITDDSAIPELTIKGSVASPTVNTGSITDHQFNYALSADRKWGMIWGTAVVKGAGASSTRVECSTGITVSPAPSTETIIDGVVAGYTYTSFSQRPYMFITTSGEVKISWRCSTNNNPIQFNTGLVRFADFY